MLQEGRRTGRKGRLATLAASVLAATLGMAGLGAAPAMAASSTSGATYFVDCAASAAGADGSSANPFTTLAEVNALTLQPGDQVLFDRGTTCTGTLQPGQSGAAGAPIVFGAYGSASADPTLDGNGGHDVVLLQNVDHITVQDLAITDPESPGTERNGVRIALTDFGQAQGYTLQNLDIHDVLGNDDKGVTGSAAIQVGITGSKTPTWINGLSILGNTITDSGREGIYTKSTWNQRSQIGTQDTSGTGPWTPSTGVVIENNTLTGIFGDGIKVDSSQGALIEHNTISGFDTNSKANNAGIWPFNSDGTIVAYNDVSGSPSSADGMAFDADGGSQNSIFEYNYSHDNDGGFMMWCPYSGAITWGTITRYNISYNDGTRIFRLCPGNIQNTQVYGNTIVDETASPAYLVKDDGASHRGITFSDNIFVDRSSTPAQVQSGVAGLEFDHNTIIGATGVPANADGTTNPGGSSADPGFVDETHEPADMADAAGLQLHATSPAVGAGVAVPGNGGVDYYGNTVPATGEVNEGAYNGTGAVGAASAVISLPSFSVVAGVSSIVTATVTWWGAQPPQGAAATLAVPAGWRVVAAHAILPGGLKAGQTAQVSWKVTPAASATGSARVTASVSSAGTVLGSTVSTANVASVYPNIEAAFNDVAITADGANPYTGDLAVSDSSLSSNELLKLKGIASGASVQGSKVTYTWPTFTPGQKDAVWAQGQSIALSGQGQYLGFVLFGVNAHTPIQATASVTYTDGTSASFPLSTGDWYYANPTSNETTFATMSYRNTPSGVQNGTYDLYESTIPLDDTKQVAYVTLPNLAPYANGKTPGELVLAMGIGGTAATTPVGAVTVNPTTVQQGQTVTFSGSGFYDSEQVSATVHSDPVSLAPVTASAGDATLSWTVPADFPTGTHTITLTGADSHLVLQSTFQVVAAPTGGSSSTPGTGGTSGTAPVSATSPVATASSSGLADTGSDVAGAVAVGVVALILGVIAIVARRRISARKGPSTPAR